MQKYSPLLLGCSKCLKEFPREAFGEKQDFTGYNMNEWQPRTSNEHIQKAEETLLATHKTRRQELEKENSVRYSAMFKLPYFDPIRFHVVDIMHNVFLGSAKHHLQILIENGYLSPAHIAEIDEVQKKIKLPSEVGRITSSISHYKSMKAEEFRNWILFYSLFCFKDVLKKKHFNIWQIFVRACKILVRISVTVKEAQEAHKLFKLYCESFVQTYGKAFATPNMHLHLHILDCIKDYGPVYATWCFGFERLNGTLGAFHTNNRSITIQFMKKFMSQTQLKSTIDQQEIDQVLELDIFEANQHEQYAVTHEMIVRKAILCHEDINTTISDFLSTPKLHCFDESEVNEIEAVLKRIYGNEVSNVQRFTKCFSRIRLGRVILSSEKYRGGKNGDKYVFCRNSPHLNPHQPAVIEDFYEVEFCLADEMKSLVFAKFGFLRHHPFYDAYGKNCPMKIYNTQFEDVKPIFPIHYIVRKCSAVKTFVKLRKEYLPSVPVLGNSDEVHIVF